MDDLPAPQSDYLQSRIRERKAESARIPRHASPATTQPARDDGIFDGEAGADALNRRRNKHLYQASTIAPPSHAGTRSTGTKSTTSSQPRAVGAREIDAHVDKLSKENFDLKLELYYRREKIDELERKLENINQLEQDAAELVEVNQDLCMELDKRDRAIDEAVVMICDLEDRVRRLEEQLLDTRPSSLTIGTSASDNTSALLPEMPTRNSTGHNHSSPLRKADENSPRWAGTTTPEAERKPKNVPSFMASQKPTTNVLRSMFVHNGQQIRPIPSSNSLVSGAESRDEEILEEPPRSPGLSELSESDFKSIYGRTTPKQTAPPTLDDLPDSPSVDMSPVVIIPRERKLARTNQWVNERAISPVLPHRRSSQGAYEIGQQFQSLGDALQRDIDPIPRPMSTTLSRKPPLRFRPAGPRDPDTRLDVPYGQNTLPPTPDTMATRKLSHQSSSSVVQDRSTGEQAAVADQHAQFSRYLDSQTQPEASNRDYVSLMSARDARKPYSDEFDRLAAQDFGAALFRHEGYYRDASSMPTRFGHAQRPSEATTTSSESRPDLHSHSQQLQPLPIRRSHHTRPNSIHINTPSSSNTRVASALPQTLASNLASERPLHRSISLSPAGGADGSLSNMGTVTFHNSRSGDLALSPVMPARQSPPKPPPAMVQSLHTRHTSQSSRDFSATTTPRSISFAADTASTTTSSRPATAVAVDASTDSNPPKLASSIRSRMARLTHRTNTSSTLSTPDSKSRRGSMDLTGKSLPPLPLTSRASAVTPSPSISATTSTPQAREPASAGSATPTPSSRRHSRSASATRRFFTQHRRRSSATPSSPTLLTKRPNSKSGPESHILRSRDSDTSEESARLGRTAAFLTAATAAAPFLSFDINKSAKPIPGVGTNPPLSASTSAPGPAPLPPSSSGIPMIDAEDAARGTPPVPVHRRRGSAGIASLAGRVSNTTPLSANEKRHSLNLSGYDVATAGSLSGWRP